MPYPLQLGGVLNRTQQTRPFHLGLRARTVRGQLAEGHFVIKVYISCLFSLPAMQTTLLGSQVRGERCILQQPWIRVRSHFRGPGPSRRSSPWDIGIRWSRLASPCCAQATSLERVKPLRFEPSCAAKSTPPSTQGKRDAVIRQEVYDVIATARSKSTQAAAPADSPTHEVR